MKVGSVVNNIPYRRVVNLLFRNLLKPIILDTVEFEFAIPGQLTKQLNRAALGNPQLEPVLTTQGAVMLNFPDKSSMTLQTMESLLMQHISSVTMNGM